MTYISVAMRRRISERANQKCEYCLMSEADSYWAYEVDYIFAEKHGGETVESNLCLSCPDCNRYKGSDLAFLDPQTTEPVFLFHPRRDGWNIHFRLNGAYIEPLTPEGRATVRLLHFNDQERIKERTRLIALGDYP
jgi:hypothetical protein